MKKLMFAFIFGIFLISFTSAITITKTSLDTPNNIIAQDLGAGTGSLSAGTYYYKIMAVRPALGSGYRNEYGSASSMPSEEINITVANDNSAVNLTWDSATWAVGYIVWRTTVSGDYFQGYNGSTYQNNCNTLLDGDTKYYGYSSYTKNLTDDGHITGTQSIIYIIPVWDFEKPLLTISGGNSSVPFNMEYLYQYDQSQSWGHITRTGDKYLGYTYTLKADIYIPYGNSIYWKEEPYENNWIMYGGISTGNVGSGLREMYIGRKIKDEIPSITTTIKWMRIQNYNLQGSLIFNFDNLEWYNVNSQVIGYSFYINRDVDNYVYYNPWEFQSNGNYHFLSNYKLENCNFEGAMYDTAFYGTTGYGGYVKNCNFVNGARTFRLGGRDYSGYSFEDNYIADDSQCLNIESVQGELVGGKFVSPASATKQVFLAYSTAELTLTDVDYNLSLVDLYLNSLGATLLEKHRIDLKIIDEDNNPIENASVLLYYNNGSLAFNETTNSNGEITQQKVLTLMGVSGTTIRHNLYENETTIYSPFNLIISKDNYETYSMNFTIDKQIDYTINLEDRDWNYSNDLKFVVRNATNTLLKIDEFGNLAVKGQIYENTNSSYINYLNDVSFRIQDYLVVTKQGAVYLLGKVMEEII